MFNDTKMGMMALLLTGEMIGAAEAAPLGSLPPSDQTSANPAPVVEVDQGSQVASTTPSHMRAPTYLVAANDNVQDQWAMPTSTQYIGGELQQMNMR